MPRTASLLLLLLVILSLPRPGQGQVRWETDLESAMARAKAEGKPMLISMHTSTEVACRRMLEKLYTDPDILPLLAEFVILPTCFDLHEEEKRTIDGKEVSVSPLFGTLGCAQLQRNEADVRDRFFDKADVKVPQHVFVGDDGEIYLGKIYELKKPAFVTLLTNALILYGSKVSDGMDEVTKGFLAEVEKGSMQEKRKAVHGLLDFQDPRRVDILHMTMQGLKKEAEKGECVRAFGKENYAFAAPAVMKALNDPSEYVRNCAVVSLEEMKATEAGEKLLAMFEKENDKEFRKDILRALGPCGGGLPKIKEVLVDNVKDRREDNRIACYLSLGYHLHDQDVQELLAKQWKKEGKSIAAKTAIIWAYTFARDESLIPQLDELIAKERNGQLKYLVEAAKLQITTGSGVAPEDGRSGHIKLHNAMGAILSGDKIPRNAYKYWKGDD